MLSKIEIINILRECISLVTGLNPKKTSLGGASVNIESSNPLEASLAKLFQDICHGNFSKNSGDLNNWLQDFSELEGIFCTYYSSPSTSTQLKSLWEKVKSSSDPEIRAEAITKIFLPEMDITEKDILPRWKVTDVQPSANPITPQEVVLQLNALYSLPDEIPQGLSQNLIQQWNDLNNDPGEKLADYDHPVPLFEKDENHELLTCLNELNKDIEFEKEKDVLPNDYTVPLLISLSVTHRSLDKVCGDWIEELLHRNKYQHLKCIVLTEEKITQIKSNLLKKDFPVYTVLGKYATHFNALKYSQLILEKVYGIRAGFKLDTDEGIRSSDLYKATGKTWFQTLCHPLWGAVARDVHGKTIHLDINEGEYVNKKDIDALGYAGAMRTPDVGIPKTYVSEEIFFNKAFVHGKCTHIYNQFDKLEEHISHPVVKGGGYGITNSGLRRAVPFTYSRVGRAEDQQFYFCSLAGGCRGIFHPDLRIAHYKSAGGAVHKAEQKTTATRFMGDMYRLNIFSYLVTRLPSLYSNGESSTLKYDIDPMPGVFASPLARLQSYLNLIYKAYSFCQKGQNSNAEVLLKEGYQELKSLQLQIENNVINKELKQERKLWEAFVQKVDSLDKEQTTQMLNSFII